MPPEKETALVLGHGNLPILDPPRCLAASDEDWEGFKRDYIMVTIDNDEHMQPTVLHDLTQPWPFESDSAAIVLDTTGLGTSLFKPTFWKELFRVMKPGAKMISHVYATSKIAERAASHGFVVKFTAEKTVEIVKPGEL